MQYKVPLNVYLDTRQPSILKSCKCLNTLLLAITCLNAFVLWIKFVICMAIWFYNGIVTLTLFNGSQYFQFTVGLWHLLFSMRINISTCTERTRIKWYKLSHLPRESLDTTRDTAKTEMLCNFIVYRPHTPYDIQINYTFRSITVVANIKPHK